MVRTQVQFTSELSDKLRKLASNRDVSMAEIIREGMERYVRTEEGPTRDELFERVFETFGKYRSDYTDIARNHDKYLTEDWAK